MPGGVRAELDGSDRVLYHAKAIWPRFIACVLVVTDRLIAERPTLLERSIDGFDASAVSGRFGEWMIAGDDRRLNRFGEGDVHGVVRGNVVSQLPRTTQQIEMGVTMEIEVGEIRNRFVGTGGRHFTGAHETSKALNDLDVQEMRRVELVLVTKETGLYACAARGLQEKLQERRGVDHDHADSRSSRMTTAAGVLRLTRFRL
jgi:hypothetical protein